MAAVGVLAVVALDVGAANLESAERDRLSARQELLETTAKGQAAYQQSTVLASLSRGLAFVPGGTASNGLWLPYFVNDTASDRTSLVALIAVDGSLLASVPDGSSFNVEQLGPTWSGGVAGNIGFSPSFRYGGELSSAQVIPIGEGQPWGVLVIVRPAADSWDQAFYVQLGASNGERGGMLLVDPAGIILRSWDSTRLGQTALAPEAISALPLGGTQSWTGTTDGAETTFIGTRLPSGYGLVFEQQTDLLFGDLRTEQRQRDATLLAVLAGTTLALVAFQISRQWAARRAEDRVYSLLENGQDLVLVVDAVGSLSFVSPSITSLLGHRDLLWRQRPLHDLVCPDDRERLEALVARPGGGSLMNLRLAAAGGGFRWFDIEASDLRNHREIGGVLLTCHEVGQRKALEDKLASEATHDALTGLANRASFAARLDELLADGRPFRPVALMYLDLDYFKPINDTYGHDAGDQVLKTVATRLADAVGPNGLMCRFGGDEFGCVVDDADEEVALLIAMRLLDAARQPVAVGTNLVRVDASIGIALAAAGVALPNIEELIRQADHAMYEAKEAGRGRYLLFVPESVPEPIGFAGAATDSQAQRGAAEEAAKAPVGERPGSVEVSAPVDDASMREPVPRVHPRGSLASKLGAALPLVAAVVVVAGIGGIGQLQTAASRTAAETRRLDETVAQTARSAEFLSEQYDPQGFLSTVNAAPFALDGGEADTLFVTAILKSPEIGEEGVAVLSTPDGRALAAAPASARVPVAVGEAPWRTALAGRAGFSPIVHDADEDRTYYYYPVIRNGAVVAVLTFGMPMKNGIMQDLIEKLGSIGTTSGWSLVDGTGIAMVSWNKDAVGQQLADPRDLATVDGGQGRLVGSVRGELAAASLVPSLSMDSPVFLLYTTPPNALYHDLRTGQIARDATLLGVVLAAVAGLALVHHRREQAARRNEQRLDALLQHTHDIIAVLTPDGRATFVSSAISLLLGHEPELYVGKSLLDLVHPDQRVEAETVLVATLDQGRAGSSNIRLRHADGTYRWFDLDLADLRQHREIAGVLLTGHEIGERKALSEELSFQARHDQLTGLPNRASFAASLTELSDDDLQSYAVLFIDLDHFKPVNDTFGHDGGDLVLRTISNRLQTTVRSVGDERRSDLICRLGGDEFVILLLDVTVEQAEQVARRVLAVVAQPITIGTHQVEVGATVGLALAQPQANHPDAVMRNADLAMYRAKEAGRGRYEVFAG